jgi:hypothetical protein
LIVDNVNEKEFEWTPIAFVILAVVVTTISTGSKKDSETHVISFVSAFTVIRSAGSKALSLD